MKKRIRMRWLVVLGAGLLLLVLAGSALAAGGLALTRSVLTSGGGEVQNGSLRLQSVTGLPVAGKVSAGSLGLCTGLWCERSPETSGQATPQTTPQTTPQSTPQPAVELFMPITTQ